MGEIANLAPHDIARTIGERLGDLRRQRRLSLQDVADRAGLAKSHVWEIEAGRSANPTISTAFALATALGVSLDYLTGLSTTQPDFHPDALRIACEVDALLRKAGRKSRKNPEPADG